MHNRGGTSAEGHSHFRLNIRDITCQVTKFNAALSLLGWKREHNFMFPSTENQIHNYYVYLIIVLSNMSENIKIYLCGTII